MDCYFFNEIVLTFYRTTDEGKMFDPRFFFLFDYAFNLNVSFNNNFEYVMIILSLYLWFFASV